MSVLAASRRVCQVIARTAIKRSAPYKIKICRNTRLYVPEEERLVIVPSGCGDKLATATCFTNGTRAGTLIYTRRPHFFISKKKK